MSAVESAIVVFLIISAYSMLMSIMRLINFRFNILNKKLNAVLSSTDVEYPLVKDISSKAVRAIKNGDRNKAMNIILQKTMCSKDQAEKIIEKIEIK